MRKYTLLLSVTIHVAAAFTLLLAPIFAAAQLPDVREPVAWVPIRVATPPPLGDPNSAKPPSRSIPSNATPQQPPPLEAPSTMPDPGIPTPHPSPLPGFAGGPEPGGGVIGGTIGGDHG